MPNETEETLVGVLAEIRTWLKVAMREPVKASLEAALPDAKSRTAYQMFDGNTSFEQVRVACKMSPNSVVALTARCSAMGLMELTPEKKRVRLFDLKAFDLLPGIEATKPGVEE
ncbi:hypothetical protein DevBK_14600 [Devosia sp. BK]|uniref:hypothetical protein n=1 Tax=Devosia sp. BK TaxID=2871706 RepID=UPI002939ACB5|nr:hypothetical protein [Devosia sp. BK]MDV3252567.1 hypothetical protein [Devosia sp. BK]